MFTATYTTVRRYVFFRRFGVEITLHANIQHNRDLLTRLQHTALQANHHDTIGFLNAAAAGGRTRVFSLGLICQ